MSAQTIGYFYAFLGATLYAGMSFLVHWNPGQYPPEQLVFVRVIFSCLVLLPFCYRELPRYFHKDSFFLWLRSTSGAVGVILYFYTLQGTSSANGNLIFSSSPIFVCLFAWIFFREKITRLELMGILGIVLGNALLYVPHTGALSPSVGLLGLSAAFFASIAFLSLGEATKHYSSAVIVFGFSAMSALFAYLSPGSQQWLPLQQEHYWYLGAIALMGLLSQWTTTLSFAHLKSPVATALGRTAILLSSILDITVARRWPSIFEFTAYIVVVLSIYLVRGRKKAG